MKKIENVKPLQNYTHNLNKREGITLIALVVTIIILLILAGITLATLTGDNGLFTRAKQAKQNTIDAQERENLALESYENAINDVIDGTVDSSREQITVDKQQYEQLLKDVEDNKEKYNQLLEQIEDLKNDNMEKLTNLTWTLLVNHSSGSTYTYTKYNVNIDEYNFLAIAISAPNEGVVNPIVISVKQFKEMFTSNTNALISQIDSRASFMYYNNGLYVMNSTTGNPALVYGIK